MIAQLLTGGNFASDVAIGLSSNPKYLPSKYFYDKQGDELFSQITKLPEYYLSRSELEIFQVFSSEIMEKINISGLLNVVELGAGDGTKTSILLKTIIDNQQFFHYYPIDISENALALNFRQISPLTRSITPIKGEYFEAIDYLPKNHHLKLFLFLGSSIGNIAKDETHKFFNELSNRMNKGDYLLLGVDLKKDPEIIYSAYNDRYGITRDFNLNLLHRINTELGADFKINEFQHRPIYDEKEGEARSYLMSSKNQTVRIDAIKGEFHFNRNETMLTEISRKFDIDMVQQYGKTVSLKLIKVFTDAKKYFADVLFRRI